MANPDKTDVIDQTKRTRSKSNASCGDAANSPVANFEQSLDELETLVQRMETGDLALEDSLTAYERGIALYRQCRGALDDAELRVKLLSDPLDPENADDFKPDAS